MIAAAPVPADVVTTDGQLGGVPVVYVDIPGTTTYGVILYFHGGFFAIGHRSRRKRVACSRSPANSGDMPELRGVCTAADAACMLMLGTKG